MLAILGIFIRSEQFRAGRKSMCIHRSGWQIENLGILSSGSVTRWRGWRSGQRWRWLWSWLSASVRCRCTCWFVCPACLWILCGTILARKASVWVVLTKHSRMSFYCSHHHFMHRKLNSPLLLFSDFSARFLDQILHFLYCGMQKPSSGHFGHIQGQVHVRLFQLYPTFLPCHSSRHVGNQEEISCCF